MPNKYLEKISSWEEIDKGLYYNSNDGGHYGTSKATSEKFIKQHNRQHVTKGALSLGAFGVGMVPLLAGKQLFKNPKRTGKVALVMAGLGAGVGALAGHAGNKQISRESKINKQIEKRVNKIGFKPY